MLVTWPYHIRGSIIETFDPRARWFASFLILGAIMQFWDVRIISIFFVLVLIQYALCKLTFKETRVAWAFLILLVVPSALLITAFSISEDCLGNPKYWPPASWP